MIQYPRLVAFAAASFLLLSAAASFGQKIYWLGGAKVQRANLDGSNVETLVSNDFAGTFHLALDRSARKVYWSEETGIRRSNMDGSIIEGVVGDLLSRARAIAIEPQGKRLYWFDLASESILRANLDGSNIETIIILPGSFLDKLVVNATDQRIYWADKSGGGLQRAELGGSNVETLLAEGELSRPGSIAIDSQGRKIYWTDVFRENIRRANLDGTDVEVLGVGGDGASILDLEIASGKMYWTAFTDGSIQSVMLQRANLDGTDAESVFVGRFVGPFGVFPSVIRLDAMSSRIYWIGGARIQRARFDGSEVETILAPRFLQPSGLALDLSSKYVYWTQRARGEGSLLQRVTLDGSVIEELISTDPQTVLAIDISLDRVARKVYWLQSTNNGTIRRANYDGSDMEDVLIGAFWVTGRLALDAGAGKMYWTDIAGARDTPTVFRRANLDGTDVEVLLTMDLPERISFTLDLKARKMYWSDGEQVFRANLDGTAFESLVPQGSELGYLGVFAVDPLRNKMYWGATGSIRRASLDGSNIEDVVIGVSGAIDIALDLGCGAVDCQANGVGDECEPDTDGDGFINGCDTCPTSDLRSNVFVNSCDTRVSNQLLDGGCSMNDRIARCHGRFPRRNDLPRCVGNLARAWRRRGLITGRQLGLILRCVGRQQNPGNANDPTAKVESRN